MSRHTLYAYADGADLSEVAESIERQLRQFVRTEQWSGSQPAIINQRAPESTAQAGDLPSWDLGLNLALPDRGAEPPDWFQDVEMIARFMGRLHALFRRDFVIGVCDNVTGIAEDLYFVESDVPDLSKLRRVVGTGGPSASWEPALFEMKYFFLEPEVVGGLGENTILDASVHPPRIERLHVEIGGWLGDAILETFPCVMATKFAAEALERSGATGIEFAELEVSASAEFHEMYPVREVPSLCWLKVTGDAGKHDFGIATDLRLVVSERALDVLRPFGIQHALVEQCK